MIEEPRGCPLPGACAAVEEIELLRQSAQKWARVADQWMNEHDRLRAGIQAMLDGDYPNPRAHRPGACPHHTPYYQECAQCDTAWLQGLLNPSPHE